MSEATGPDKRAIQQQASAMFSSVVSQERVISYLRTLEFPAADPAVVQAMAETIGMLQVGCQDLINHFEFLEVAHDHGWEAARIYREDLEDTSKRVQQAVERAKKKKEADDRDRKWKKANRSSSSSSSGNRRRHRYSEKTGCSHSHSHSASHLIAVLLLRAASRTRSNSVPIKIFLAFVAVILHTIGDNALSLQLSKIYLFSLLFLISLF